MGKIMKYLKRSAGSILCILALLFLQASCELSLPTYTSDIVNVGIQQKGILDGVPEEIRSSSLEDLELFMDGEDRKTVESCYDREGEQCILKEDLSKTERERLNEILGKPILLLYSLTQDEERAQAVKEQMGLPPKADLLDAIRQLPSETVEKMLESSSEQIDQMPDSLITQTAVAYVQQEYGQMGRDVDRIQIRYILKIGLMMLGVAFLSMAAAVLVTFLSARVAAVTGHDLRNSVYRKVIGFSSGEYNRFSTASLITRSTNDIQQIQLLMAMVFRIAMYAPIMGIGGILKVLKTDASMSWIIALAVALIVGLVLVLFAVAMPRFKKLQVLIDRLNLVTREILTGLSVIRAFSREEHEKERFEEANRNLTRTNLFVNRCMTFMMPTMMLIMNGVSILIVYNGGHAVDNGTMQVGDMMAFIQYAMQIIMSFLMLTMLSIMLPRASVSAGRIAEVLDTEPMICDPDEPEGIHPGMEGTVSFEHVSFSYPDADERVLRDVTFTAKKGETVAFIGSTGSGKSTLLNLIPRFYDVTEGAVKVDGVDVRKMSQKDLRSRLGYVPQKSVLFSGTIRSNIAYGCPDAPHEQVEQAAAIAQAEDFIREKPEKYGAPISQGGSNVSGGQKQRLSIARAIAKRPEIFLFDDSFSALDLKTDAALRRALKRATADTTTLIVAQRISTIIHADQILVLERGRVVGQGTHPELMENCEVYRQIAMSQLSEEELAG